MTDRVDRLSALLSRFHAAVSVVQPGAGNLLIVSESESLKPTRIEPCNGPRTPATGDGTNVLVELLAAWGGPANPLLRAFRQRVSLSIGEDDETEALVRSSWRNDELAEVAGLSLSRFADVFQARLG